MAIFTSFLINDGMMETTSSILIGQNLLTPPEQNLVKVMIIIYKDTFKYCCSNIDEAVFCCFKNMFLSFSPGISIYGNKTKKKEIRTDTIGV